MDHIDFVALYRDQAPLRTPFVSAAYTPHGIQMLDSRFGQAIRAASTLEDCRYIANKIRKNPHLHNDIKRNLMFNLGNYRKAIGRGFGPKDHVCGSSCYVTRRGGLGCVWQEKVCAKRHIEEL